MSLDLDKETNDELKKKVKELNKKADFLEYLKDSKKFKKMLTADNKIKLNLASKDFKVIISEYYSKKSSPKKSSSSSKAVTKKLPSLPSDILKSIFGHKKEKELKSDILEILKAKDYEYYFFGNYNEDVTDIMRNDDEEYKNFYVKKINLNEFIKKYKIKYHYSIDDLYANIKVFMDYYLSPFIYVYILYLNFFNDLLSDFYELRDDSDYENFDQEYWTNYYINSEKYINELNNKLQGLSSFGIYINKIYLKDLYSKIEECKEAFLEINSRKGTNFSITNQINLINYSSLKSNSSTRKKK
mgnify:CR=1 FL=1|tara:strand:+ start:17 stop:916 length:900 start_codon:yes stop_codon:yes gene_type:complete